MKRKQFEVHLALVISFLGILYAVVYFALSVYEAYKKGCFA